MRRKYTDYIEDILDSIKKAKKFTENMSFKEFAQDDKTIFAVIRALEIVGEAAKKIPDKIRAKYPEIPWKEIAGMRDKLIHEYFGIKLEVVWETVKKEIPSIEPEFEKILKDLENET
ncbi:MAG: DUF86 domain-containing protein [Nitrososphaerales archaeon]